MFRADIESNIHRAQTYAEIKSVYNPSISRIEQFLNLWRVSDAIQVKSQISPPFMVCQPVAIIQGVFIGSALKVQSMELVEKK